MLRRIWTDEELLVALDLYCRTPFGLFHAGNHEIQSVASLLGRTPDALAMKLSNFAALDPVHQSRGIKGLRNNAKADQILMQKFLLHPQETIKAAGKAFQNLGVWKETEPAEAADLEEGLLRPIGPTEKTQTVQVRVVQRFFRNAVLSSYDFKCAFCALDIPELLNASHIIPWKTDESQRANPRNGLSLCALHDRAFDRGLVTLDDAYKIVLATRLKDKAYNAMWETAFFKL